MTRAGRVRKLARSSRSKFKMVWHQFSTAQFPSHPVCLVSSFSSVRAAGDLSLDDLELRVPTTLRVDMGIDMLNLATLCGAAFRYLRKTGGGGGEVSLFPRLQPVGGLTLTPLAATPGHRPRQMA